MRFSKVAAAVAVASVGMGLIAAGCGGDDTKQQTPSGANCQPTDASCNVVKSECLALADNANQTTLGLRISQLSITLPTVLASGTVANTVGRGVTMARKPCHLDGDGTFSWLLQVDTKDGSLCTGGAKPVTDPADGYSFVAETITQNGKAFDVKPIKVAGAVTGSAIEIKDGQDITVPIYLADYPMNPNAIVLLPLRKARIFSTTLSDNNNCIGKFNADGLDPINLCLPEEGHPSFINAGKLEGYITLEDADTVSIDILHQSLCVVLSNDPNTYGDGGMPLNKCKRDGSGKITLKGDWCSTTNMAADASCADSFKLGADFAALAVKINNTCAP